MDREVFRLIIVIIGLLVMAGIYYFDPGRRQQLRDGKPWKNKDEKFSDDSDSADYVRTDQRDSDQNLNIVGDDSGSQANDQQFIDQEIENHKQTISETTRQQNRDSYISEISDDSQADLSSALNDAEHFDVEDLKEHDSQSTGEKILSPFSEELDDKVDSELEINSALLEPLADPDTDSKTDETRKEAEAPSVIMMHLVARNGAFYQGPAINDAFIKAELQYGNMEIYHYMDYQQNRELFSVANIREPGTFPEQMTYFETDGMILFMQPQTIDNPLQVFDKMVACADILFKELGGEILDDKQQPISKEYLEQQRYWLKAS